MFQVDAAKRVLEDNRNRGLHYAEITRRAISKGYMQTQGLTPSATICSKMTINPGVFTRVGPGIYKLLKHRVILPVPEGRQEVKKTNRSAGQTSTNDPGVRTYVIHDANGVCQLCKGTHFMGTDIPLPLEIHHLIPTNDSHNGPDVQENAVALCPTCHKVLQANWQGVMKPQHEMLVKIAESRVNDNENT